MDQTIGNHVRPQSQIGDDLLGFVIAATLSIGACWLFLQNQDYPLGVQLDEPKKVRFILNGQQDFMHPILMLQAARLANWFAGLADQQQVIELGRSISAVFGGILVFGSYLLARLAKLSTFEALTMAAIVAVAPLTSLQAQVVKEDIYVGATMILALSALIGLANQSTPTRAVLFGITAGFAAAAKHVGILVLLLPLLVPFSCQLADRTTFWRLLPAAFATAVAAYVVLNLPALIAYETSAKGLAYEVEHVTQGHGNVSVSPFKTYFTHYVREGWIKGLGAFIAVTGLVGMLVAAVRFKHLNTGLRIALLFCAIWYFAHELAPMKPGVSRYMVPTGPIVVLFAVWFLRELVALVRPTWATPVAVSLAIVCAILPAQKTFAYLLRGEADTTQTAVRFLDDLGGTTYYDSGMPEARLSEDGLDSLAGQAHAANREPGLDLLAGWDYVATRNVRGTRITSDKGRLAATQKLYAALYGQPYLDIEHVAKEYEFRNRKIRIIDLKGNGARLKELAATYPWPSSVHVSFNPQAGLDNRSAAAVQP